MCVCVPVSVCVLGRVGVMFSASTTLLTLWVSTSQMSRTNLDLVQVACVCMKASHPRSGWRHGFLIADIFAGLGRYLLASSFNGKGLDVSPSLPSSHCKYTQANTSHLTVYFINIHEFIPFPCNLNACFCKNRQICHYIDITITDTPYYRRDFIKHIFTIYNNVRIVQALQAALLCVHAFSSAA